jgi:hypothetical protein
MVRPTTCRVVVFPSLEALLRGQSGSYVRRSLDADGCHDQYDERKPRLQQILCALRPQTRRSPGASIGSGFRDLTNLVVSIEDLPTYH